MPTSGKSGGRKARQLHPSRLDQGAGTALRGAFTAPPLAKSRLEEREDGNLMLRLSRTWSDGTAALVFSPLELVEKLAALIPQPRTNQIIYTGVFAPAASWRDAVVPVAVERESEGALKKGSSGPCPAKKGKYYWADLLWRVFSVNCSAPVGTELLGPRR